MELFLAAFIPLFVAIDAPGILPAFLSVTNDLSSIQRKKITNQAVITAFVISVFFIFLGKIVFQFLGISISDFKIAGGALLLVFAINDVLFDVGERRKGGESSTVGVVPIGTPLIIGPAALTTMLLTADKAGFAITMISLVLNIGIVWLFFYNSEKVIKVITKSGATAIGKVFAIFLAAIGIALIRSGIIEIIKSV